MGAARTWQLRLKETAATVKNFMLMVVFWYWKGGKKLSGLGNVK